MRIITLHCDYIKFKALKKALKSIKDLSEEEKEEKEVKEPLVVLTAVESGDSDKEYKEYIESVKKTAGEVKAENIVLYPYAHLSSSLAKPDEAQSFLERAEKDLKKDFKVSRAPFGYYKSFELKVKGHPLSELSKEFGDKETISKPIKVEEKEEDPEKLLREISRAKLDVSKLKANDHRIIGQKMDLFSFNDVSPGSVFWHHNGLVIYNELVDYIRGLLKRYDYKEVSTPQVLDNKLWKISGHWGHYKENMFLSEYEGRAFGVKPMNCPGGLLIYKSDTRSYKDLPIRMAEFGTVHRQELSGVLAGLFRVIRFTQDDAHIFCTEDQLEDEIGKILELIEEVYKKRFGFDYSLELSTRPDKFMGDKKDWDFAEKRLEKALKNSKLKYKINEGDGAFYGPKIDFHIKDSLKRSWQLATIQLDMQMPQRFKLEYIGEDNTGHTPIMIHRAIFGSVERFIGILLEHLNGALPVWLSPIQMKVVSFTDRNIKAAEKFVEELRERLPFLRVEADLRSTTVNEKVRDAEMMKVPYIIVIGDKEEEGGTLAVRERGSKKPKFGVLKEEFIEEISEKISNRY